MEASKKYHYFASDFHLGAPTLETSRAREKRIISWLNEIQKDAASLYLVGDVFDFWFEYKHAVPKGSVRLLGKLAEFVDAGIPVHLFGGNHDMWMFSYLQEEIGVQVHFDEYQFQINLKKFYVAHGDGLGPGDNGFKFMKFFFRNPVFQWLFARLHPNFGIGVAAYSSRSSRNMNAEEDRLYVGPEKERLWHYVKEIHPTTQADYYFFGHRHLPLKYRIDHATYINLGEWLNYETFVRFDGENAELMTWKQNSFETYITLSEKA